MTRLQATQLGQRASVCLCVRTLVSLTTQRPALTPRLNEQSHRCGLKHSTALLLMSPVCLHSVRRQIRVFLSRFVHVWVLWWMLNKMSAECQEMLVVTRGVLCLGWARQRSHFSSWGSTGLLLSFGYLKRISWGPGTRLRLETKPRHDTIVLIVVFTSHASFFYFIQSKGPFTLRMITITITMTF